MRHSQLLTASISIIRAPCVQVIDILYAAHHHPSNAVIDHCIPSYDFIWFSAVAAPSAKSPSVVSALNNCSDTAVVGCLLLISMSAKPKTEMWL